MRIFKIMYLILVITIMGSSSLLAQESLNSTGGDILSPNGSVNYTVGQTIYTTIFDSTGQVIQGIQNPVIEVIDGIESAKQIELTMLVYPNPTSNLLTLNIGNYSPRELTYSLFDLNGKLILTSAIKNEKTTISLQNLARASYVLIVLEQNQPIKSFSIIKN